MSMRLPVNRYGRTFDPPADPPPLEPAQATVGGPGPGQSVPLWYRVGGAVPDAVGLDT